MSVRGTARSPALPGCARYSPYPRCLAPFGAFTTAASPCLMWSTHVRTCAAALLPYPPALPLTTPRLSAHGPAECAKILPLILCTGAGTTCHRRLPLVLPLLPRPLQASRPASFPRPCFCPIARQGVRGGRPPAACRAQLGGVAEPGVLARDGGSSPSSVLRCDFAHVVSMLSTSLRAILSIPCAQDWRACTQHAQSNIQPKPCAHTDTHAHTHTHTRAQAHAYAIC